MGELIETSRIAVKAIKEGLLAKKVPLHHAAAALREVNNVAVKIHDRVAPQAAAQLPVVRDAKVLLELLKLAAKEERKTLVRVPEE